MKQIDFYWSQGNAGALNFLSTVLKSQDEEQKNFIIQKIWQAKTIRGANLYVLWSDICEKDLQKVENLLKNCPTAILEDACSRQDYSGRKLVSEFL